MKKFLSLTLTFLIALSCMTFNIASATTEQTEAQKLLDGKKVLIIGNSFVYYGQTVINKKNSILTQSARSNDKGYFYQLCKENGINVSVTNWCFASHGLTSLFSAPCNVSGTCKGVKHEDYLTNRYFDYVVISPGNGPLVEKNIASDFEYIMEFFRATNPNVKFVCLGPLAAYGNASTFYPGITGYYPTLKEKGVIIADWGNIVKDILKGNCSVPNATQPYVRSSFVVKDDYHPNVLSGYITTLILYCAITGESAIGQPYKFYNDATINSNFNMDTYVANRYTNGYSDTNFHKIFASESDMKGIQQLVDLYLGYENTDNKLLDGKKVLFIGNSYVYYGQVVINKKNSILTQSARSNDKGYFYQLCKENGCNVSVTNWCFGSHSLGNFFGAPCAVSGSCKGVMHEDYLTDRYFDYVIASPGSGSTAETGTLDHFKTFIEVFREANPNVKIVCLGNLGTYGYNSFDKDYPAIRAYYKSLEKLGVIIADWGTIVNGILEGTMKIPGATQTYTKNSFIVKDGYHPNVLSGYIASLVAYCAITKESAIGQPYKFYNDATINSNYNMDTYVANRYTNGYSDTNFHKIFASGSDMNGIQQLVDRQLKSDNYNLTLKKGTHTLDVNSDLSLENTLLVCALYSEESKLIDVKFLNVSNYTKSASFDISENTWDNAKIFVWEASDNLYPLDEMATISFSE